MHACVYIMDVGSGSSEGHLETRVTMNWHVLKGYIYITLNKNKKEDEWSLNTTLVS